MTNYFSRLSKEELKAISDKGNEAKRSPQLKKAWSEAHKIRGLYYDDTSVKTLASKYDVSIRQIYRIIKSDK